MPSSDSSRHPVELLAEEFAQRYRNGERPTLREYAERYPEHADDIRELFPALLAVEQLKPGAADATGEHNGAAAPPLERLGDYRILREVGRGGMGVVYEAEQVSLGRHVALKVLPAGALLDSKQLQRFEREAKAAARLHHTNIVPVYGVGEADGLRYYVMQFIQGQGLDQVLAELKRLRRPGPGGGAPTADISQAGLAAQALLSGGFPASRGTAPPRPSICRVSRKAPPCPSRGGPTGRAWPALASRWRRRWPTRTARGRCTGTSSRPTCCWMRRGRCG